MQPLYSTRIAMLLSWVRPFACKLDGGRERAENYSPLLALSPPLLLAAKHPPLPTPTRDLSAAANSSSSFPICITLFSAVHFSYKLAVGEAAAPPSLSTPPGRE